MKHTDKKPTRKPTTSHKKNASLLMCQRVLWPYTQPHPLDPLKYLDFIQGVLLRMLKNIQCMFDSVNMFQLARAPCDFARKISDRLDRTFLQAIWLGWRSYYMARLFKTSDLSLFEYLFRGFMQSIANDKLVNSRMDVEVQNSIDEATISAETGIFENIHQPMSHRYLSCMLANSTNFVQFLWCL